MPSYIIKTDPDKDLYVVWSTIVDAPTAVGSKQDVFDFLVDGYQQQASRTVGAMLARVDEFGASVATLRLDWGQDGDLYLRTGAPDTDHDYFLPRANLHAYAQALLAEDVEGSWAQLVRVDR